MRRACSISWCSTQMKSSLQTLSTISGPFQGNSAISAPTSGDCLSTVDWHEVIFITAVPIAAGFGLLLLAAFLKDLRQARKSNRSPCPPATVSIPGNRAEEECTYVIDIDYGGRSKWGSFLRWCVWHKSCRTIGSTCFVRLQGTIGVSDWMTFRLPHGLDSKQQTVTTSQTIGEILTVQARLVRMRRPIFGYRYPTTIGARLRGIINRACDTEIHNIDVHDTKTKEHYNIHYNKYCAPSSDGISSDDTGIATKLPPFLTPRQPKANYIAYYFKNAHLFTSTFMPRYQGNLTGVRHVTCLFACMSYPMLAVQWISKPLLEPSLWESVVLSPMDYDITFGMVIHAAGVSAVLLPVLVIMEVLGRVTPTIYSLYRPGQPTPTVIEMTSHILPVATNSNPILSTDSTVIEMLPDEDQPSTSHILPITINSNPILSTDPIPIPAKSATEAKAASKFCLIVIVCSVHILLIASCVLAVLWSVYSVHSFCWSAFWEWAATSIITVLIQAVIVDTLKAIIITCLKGRSNKRSRS